MALYVVCYLFNCVYDLYTVFLGGALNTEKIRHTVKETTHTSKSAILNYIYNKVSADSRNML